MSLHALVINAGIGHMATSTALRRVGLDVTRIERIGQVISVQSSALLDRENGAGMYA